MKSFIVNIFKITINVNNDKKGYMEEDVPLLTGNLEVASQRKWHELGPEGQELFNKTDKRMVIGNSN